MSRSRAPRHPLIVRLKEIIHTLQRLSVTDRMMKREARKGPSKVQAEKIKFFYDGCIQSQSLAARLIAEAIRNFPLSGTGRGQAARSLPPSKTKGARR